MSIDLDTFAARRPFLFHLTATSNIARIRESRRLHSASELLRQANRMPQNSQRRSGLLKIHIGADEVTLRDQDPLHERNIEFEDGWDFARLIELLNQRVFFWAGTQDGPVESGRNHFKRYGQSGEDVSILRVPTSSLLSTNAQNAPQFCRYNSGAPGSRDGRKIPRGSRTFQEAEACDFTVSAVKEVTFVAGVDLPDGAQIGSGAGWEQL
jgi:hypothetical protein